MAEKKIYSDFVNFCKAINGKYSEKGKFLSCSKDYGAGTTFDATLVKRPEQKENKTKYYERFGGKARDLELSFRTKNADKIEYYLDTLKGIEVKKDKIIFSGEEEVVISKEDAVIISKK